MLSQDLFREVRTEFLRLLGAKEARIYLDAADALESESATRVGWLGREEVLNLIERVVEHHAEIELEDAVGFSTREKSRLVLDRLVLANWLEVEERTDYQRFVTVSPNATQLLEALRRIARPGAAVFSDELVSTCHLLGGEGMHSEPWQTVEMCVEHVRRGLMELKAVAKSVERHTKKQLGTQTLRENFEVVFDQYAEQVGHGAYTELVRARLPTRLSDARAALERLRNDTAVLQRMVSEVQRRDGGDPSYAMAIVQNRLQELAEALDLVVPSAEQVDQRTADFTRKSFARVRYLQEVTGEQRAVVQRFFEKLNTVFAGGRIGDAEAAVGDDLPALRLCEVRLFAGLSSLRTPRLRHASGEVEALDEETSVEQRERSVQQLAATLRDALTLARANRFAKEAFEKLGPRVQSERLMSNDPATRWYVSDDQLSDLIACLLHAGTYKAHFDVQLPMEGRDMQSAEADRREHDSVLGRVELERFILAKR